MIADSSAETLDKIQIDKIIRARYLFTFTPLALGLMLMAYTIVPFHYSQTLKLTIAEYLFPAFLALSFISALIWYLQTGFRDREILEQKANFAKPNAEKEMAKNEKISQLESKIKQLQTLNSERIANPS